MSEKYDGGPAFPAVIHNNGAGTIKGFAGEDIPPAHDAEYSGMTLRDYFAAKAMVALVGAHADEFEDEASLSADAYKIADAMLKAR